MNFRSSLSLLALSSVLSVASWTQVVHASDYNRISFEVSSKQVVANDQLQATLSKTVQAATAKDIAKELNRTMNNALAIAKRYPNVSVKTGHQHTYPRYKNNESTQIIGFTGSVSLELKSDDFEQASQLMSDLQSVMSVSSLNFGVADSTQDAISKQLEQDAIKQFQSQAKSIAHAFGASDYRIVSVQLGGNQYHHSYAPAMMKSAMHSDAISPQQMQGGDTTLNYNVQGVIELVK